MKKDVNHFYIYFLSKANNERIKNGNALFKKYCIKYIL